MSVHKYDCVIHFIEEGIKNGNFKLYSKLPSLHALQIKFKLSRCSVFLAMENLKERGIIESEPAVGYYVVSTNIKTRKKIMLIFGSMNLFKEELYKTIVSHLDQGSDVDITFHYHDRSRLERLIESANGKYNTLVVMPGPFDGLADVLSRCKGRVYLIDHFNKDIASMFPSVGQDFVEDTYNALVDLLPKISKYKEITLVQYDAIEPYDRYEGVRKFALRCGMTSHFTDDLSNLEIKRGMLYLIPNDNELVRFIKRKRKSNLVMGTDYGVISFNDCDLKEVLEGGITTITTDFHQMGKTLASMVNSSVDQTDDCHYKNPWQVIVRNSI